MKDKLQKQHEILQRLATNLPNFKKSGLAEVEQPNEFYLLGAGKASVQIAQSLLESGAHIIDGILIGVEKDRVPGVQVFVGNHPYPDDDSVAASYELLSLARSIPTGETVVFCLSGGASALLCIPPYGVEVEEIQLLYKLLLNSGANIQQINTVRKHVCDLKGGKLAEELKHVRLITLIESDVPGDDISTIGSGPTVADPSTFKEAVAILNKFKIWDELPESIQRHLIFGEEGVIPENPKAEQLSQLYHKVHIISKSEGLAQNIGLSLAKEGYHVWVGEEAYSGDVKSISKRICSKAIAIVSNNDNMKMPAALVYHGESTVEVKGSGMGGRNQELALIAALSIEGQHPISVLSIGTDGIDGPTDASGAIINSFTTLDARKQKLDPEQFLQNNDSYNFHKKMNTHIKLGSTGINLMDLQVILIG